MTMVRVVDLSCLVRDGLSIPTQPVAFSANSSGHVDRMQRNTSDGNPDWHRFPELFPNIVALDLSVQHRLAHTTPEAPEAHTEFWRSQSARSTCRH